jgi:hypothetical protein
MRHFTSSIARPPPLCLSTSPSSKIAGPLGQLKAALQAGRPAVEGAWLAGVAFQSGLPSKPSKPRASGGEGAALTLNFSPEYFVAKW